MASCWTILEQSLNGNLSNFFFCLVFQHLLNIEIFFFFLTLLAPNANRPTLFANMSVNNDQSMLVRVLADLPHTYCCCTEYMELWLKSRWPYPLLILGKSISIAPWKSLVYTFNYLRLTWYTVKNLKLKSFRLKAFLKWANNSNSNR